MNLKFKLGNDYMFLKLFKTNYFYSSIIEFEINFNKIDETTII